ncbi:MAG TPA: chromate transporter [Burkholderiaceae bacterium]|nr:chromate transporter [Burkholderiaceae bacterium]
MNLDTAARPRPHSLSDLFWSMTWLALQGFGGVLAVVQRVLVDEKRWLTNEEFIEDWAVAQILPGPNVVNLALMIGDRYFGFRGALAALAGMLVFPLLIVLAVAALFASVADLPTAKGALKGMGAVSAGLIAAVGLKLVGALKENVMTLGICAVLAAMTFVAIAILRIPLAWVLLVLGSTAMAWAYRQLGVLADQSGDGKTGGEKTGGKTP